MLPLPLGEGWGEGAESDGVSGDPPMAGKARVGEDCARLMQQEDKLGRAVAVGNVE